MAIVIVVSAADDFDFSKLMIFFNQKSFEDGKRKEIRPVAKIYIKEMLRCWNWDRKKRYLPIAKSIMALCEQGLSIVDRDFIEFLLWSEKIKSKAVFIIFINSI